MELKFQNASHYPQWNDRSYQCKCENLTAHTLFIYEGQSLSLKYSTLIWASWWLRDKESTCQYRRCGLDPWQIPWTEEPIYSSTVVICSLWSTTFEVLHLLKMYIFWEEDYNVSYGSRVQVDVYEFSGMWDLFSCKTIVSIVSFSVFPFLSLQIYSHLERRWLPLSWELSVLSWCIL